jgi:ATPase subunit of ABC transporter with duplicated ATPase domains
MANTNYDQLSKKEQREAKRLLKKEGEKGPAAPVDVEAVMLEMKQKQILELQQNSGSGAHEQLKVSVDECAVVVNNLTIAYNTNDLLRDTKLVVKHGKSGHRYGVVGENGVGKTTLLTKIAAGSKPEGVPGWPSHVRTLLVEQECLGSETVTVLQSLLDAKWEYAGGHRLAARKDELEAILDTPAAEGGGAVSETTAAAAEELGDVYGELEQLDSSEAKERARTILKGLGFKGKTELQQTTAQLSGGWRTRLALAQVCCAAAAPSCPCCVMHT